MKCSAITLKGTRCLRNAVDGGTVCTQHKKSRKTGSKTSVKKSLIKKVKPNIISKTIINIVDRVTKTNNALYAQRMKEFPKRMKKIHADDKICWKLTESLLNYYTAKEKLSTNSEKFYFNSESDSNQTDFEHNMNERKICLASRLEPKYVRQLMTIFQALYDGNAFLMHPDSLDEEENIGFDVEKWVKLAESSNVKIRTNLKGLTFFDIMEIKTKIQASCVVFRVTDLYEFLKRKNI